MPTSGTQPISLKPTILPNCYIFATSGFGAQFVILVKAFVMLSAVEALCTIPFDCAQGDKGECSGRQRCPSWWYPQAFSASKLAA